MSAEVLRQAAALIREETPDGAYDLPGFALAVADWLDVEAEGYGYFHLSRANCREADQSGDCGCAYKDCYEHGKWHDCTHGEPDLTAALAAARAYLGESS